MPMLPSSLRRGLELGLGLLACAQLASVSAGADASEPHRTLRPAQFPELPAAARAAFDAAGCRVPQLSGRSERVNVIRGAFSAPGRTEWAALCWSPSRMEVRIHFAGQTACPAVLRAGQPPDGMPPASAFDDHAIAAQTPAQMRETSDKHREIAGAPEPPKDFVFTHDGIVVGNEKASMTFYCHRGRWMSFLSAD